MEALKKEWVKREVKNWLYALGIFLIITLIFAPHILFAPGGFAAIWSLVLFGLIAAAFTAYILTPIVMRFLRPLKDEKFLSMIEELSKEAGMKKPPKLTITETPEINAVAYNSIFGKRIGVTRGLVEAYHNKKLDAKEAEAVLAHELGHHKSLDTLKNSFVFSFVSLVEAIGYLIMVMGVGLARVGGEAIEPATGLLSMLIGGFMALFGFIFRMIAKLVSALAYHFSRVQEYRADAFGAELRGPETMANALRKIEELNNEVVSNQLTAKKVAALPYSSRWQVKPAKLSWIDRLFSTHPPTEKRIEALLSRGRR